MEMILEPEGIIKKADFSVVAFEDIVREGAIRGK